MTPESNRRVLAITTALVLAADLGTKAWASSALRERPIDLPGPVDLELAYNRGVAFSAFENAPVALILLVTGAVTVALAIAAWRRAIPAVPAGFLLGGAAGNVVDRIHGGSVVDLLHTGWWPTFNLADVSLSIGIGLLVLTGFRREADADDATTTGVLS